MCFLFVGLCPFGNKFLFIQKKKLLEEPDYQKIVDLLTDGKGNWSSTRKNPHESIARGSLKEETKVWFHFIGSILLPPKQLSIIR